MSRFTGVMNGRTVESAGSFSTKRTEAPGLGCRVRLDWPGLQTHELENLGWASPAGAGGAGRACENIPRRWSQRRQCLAETPRG